MRSTDASQVTKAVKVAEARRLAATGEGRRIRVALDLSCAHVAGAAGTTAPTISRWETGQRKPTGSAALRWVDVLERLARMLPEAAE